MAARQRRRLCRRQLPVAPAARHCRGRGSRAGARCWICAWTPEPSPRGDAAGHGRGSDAAGGTPWRDTDPRRRFSDRARAANAEAVPWRCVGPRFRGTPGRPRAGSHPRLRGPGRTRARDAVRVVPWPDQSERRSAPGHCGGHHQGRPRRPRDRRGPAGVERVAPAHLPSAVARRRDAAQGAPPPCRPPMPR